MSGTVVRDHTHDFPVFTDFHELSCLSAVLIEVAENDATQPSHDIQEFKIKVGIRFETSSEVIAQSSFALKSAGWCVQDLGGYRGSESYILCIVRQDGVEVVRVPRPYPLARKFTCVKVGGHGTQCKHPEKQIQTEFRERHARTRFAKLDCLDE